MGSMKATAVHEAALARDFGHTLNTAQAIGTGWDAERSGTRYEYKFDWASGMSGNYFVERMQTRTVGGERRLVPSGVSLSAQQADVMVFVNRQKAVFVAPALVLELVRRGRFPAKQTQEWVNGNRTGHHAYGNAVPCQALEAIATLVVPVVGTREDGTLIFGGVNGAPERSRP